MTGPARGGGSYGNSPRASREFPAVWGPYKFCTRSHGAVLFDSVAVLVCVTFVQSLHITDFLFIRKRRALGSISQYDGGRVQNAAGTKTNPVPTHIVPVLRTQDCYGFRVVPAPKLGTDLYAARILSGYVAFDHVEGQSFVTDLYSHSVACGIFSPFKSPKGIRPLSQQFTLDTRQITKYHASPLL